MRSYSPAQSRNQLVIPHPQRTAAYLSGSPGEPVMTRYFSDDHWHASGLRCSPEEIRRWEPISEQAWVARCVLDDAGRSSRDVARHLYESLAQKGHMTSETQKIISSRGGEMMWNVALLAASDQSPLADELIHIALKLCPGDSPGLGPWNNHVALLAGINTYGPCENKEALWKAIPNICKLVRAGRHLDRILIDIQRSMDSSEGTRAAIRNAVGGHYEWREQTLESPSSEIVFASELSAVIWLCSGLCPAPKSKETLRSKLAPIRDRVRSAKIKLFDANQEAVPSNIIIDLIDMVLAGVFPAAFPRRA